MSNNELIVTKLSLFCEKDGNKCLYETCTLIFTRYAHYVIKQNTSKHQTILTDILEGTDDENFQNVKFYRRIRIVAKII